MFYVYVLESKNGKYYIGSTRVPGDRLKAHNAGKIRSTKAFVPYKLIYKEVYSTYTEARKREFYIKNRKSREYIEGLVNRGVA